MKLKKLLALACSLVMASSLFASTAMVADAAVEGATATLEFAGYEVKGTTTFAKINVKATIPDTLVPYELVAADWVETFEDTYKGCMVQTVGFQIPNVSGLTYVASLSSCAEYVQIQDDKTNGELKIYAANTGAYDTYYAGTVDTLATLYYRITGDVNGTYDVALSNAVIGLVDVAPDGTVTPREYTKNDFAITNATVKPAKVDLPADRADAVKLENCNQDTFVEVELKGNKKNFFLPTGVKGYATVYGLLKYTVDNENIKSGDVFTVKAIDIKTKDAVDTKTVTVK